jgi:hypothetical protein
MIPEFESGWMLQQNLNVIDIRNGSGVKHSSKILDEINAVCIRSDSIVAVATAWPAPCGQAKPGICFKEVKLMTSNYKRSVKS